MNIAAGQQPHQAKNAIPKPCSNKNFKCMTHLTSMFLGLTTNNSKLDKLLGHIGHRVEAPNKFIHAKNLKINENTKETSKQYFKYQH